jgi:Asp-tRNA(Asn)/Glu-tRNA(Gln) amidotransferase A subunit family amidase
VKAAEQLHYASLVQVGDRLKARQLSPVELAQATLARIERLNARLGAYYTAA